MIEEATRHTVKALGGLRATAESRAYLDCATITDKSHAVKYVWWLIVLYPSRLKISDVYKALLS
jgi:hypothetical protein